jgi:hypothetical protein
LDQVAWREFVGWKILILLACGPAAGTKVVDFHRDGIPSTFGWGAFYFFFFDFDFLTGAHFFEGVAAFTRAIDHWWADMPGRDPEEA